MEHKKIINLLDNENTQLSKFRTKNQVEINYQSHRTHDTKKTFKFSMLKSSLCNYRFQIFAKGTITVANSAAGDANSNNTNKKVRIKTCASFD